MSTSTVEFANRSPIQESNVPPVATPVGPHFAPNSTWRDMTFQQSKCEDYWRVFWRGVAIGILCCGAILGGFAVAGTIEAGWGFWTGEAAFVIIALLAVWRSRRDYEAVFYPRLYPLQQDDLRYFYHTKHSVHDTPEARAVIMEKFRDPATSFAHVHKMLHGVLDEHFYDGQLEGWETERQLNFGPLVRHGYMTEANAEAIITLDAWCTRQVFIHGQTKELMQGWDRVWRTIQSTL